MDSDDGWIRHRFAPGEEPSVYTADLCDEAGGHENCKQIDEYEGKPVFCIRLCHRPIKRHPN